MYEEISRKKIEKDFFIAATKIRWGKMGKPIEEIVYD